ncbi:rod shape-determining protein MreC [Paenibacillus cremeus]|uniref:Cell shape-determining protein MreC n=1 Tax=Paenibacillus cremeus TaxID=2163881 RepID=A0A559KIE2_9BACL|nr:rod shape-determining protein MreC [Paenibacillus cremeus]TVY11904.1 rod shape-determining protein MreC [Paenibacillus cremeus]
MKLLGNKRLLILMLGFIMLIALMGLTYGRSYMTWPEKFLKDTVSFTQGLLYKPAGYIAGFFQDIKQLRTLYEENTVLRQTLTKYARDTTRLNDLEQQNKRLQDALGFTERQKQMNQYTFRIAEVTEFNQQNKMVTINLGEKDGIRPNMAVMSVEGLIGRVVRVSAFYADVQLLTGMQTVIDSDDKLALESKAISVTVKGHENESYGFIEYYNPESQTLVMTKIEAKDPIQPGDTIITSGKGLVFPRGIEVGKVLEKRQGDFGITFVASIQPFASFNHLREVFVVQLPELK